MSDIAKSLRRAVEERASGCCEYCLLRVHDSYLPHEVDHIRAEKHRGTTTLDNLCFACWDCNRHKGSDIASFDPDTDALTPLFHPRRDRWDEHFRLDGTALAGLTPIGRVTVFLLNLNSEDQLARRELLIEMGRYPCG